MTSDKRKKRPPRTTPRKWTDRLSADDLRNIVVPADERSKESDIGSDLSVGTPSSVLVNGYSLSRDLSDLSGSYMNGNTAPRSIMHPPGVYPSDQSEMSYHRPWHQAHILSSRGPLHPQPPADCDDSVRMDQGKSLVVVDNCDIIEIIKHVDTDDRTVCSECTFIPIIILLMDPGRKVYELMQLWIDVKHDTVRDVLHSIQNNLGEKWRQDYDGIFNLRNNHFSPLIHILNVSKYDVHSFEVWVAKPWSMSAQNTVAYASGVLNHLKHLGVFKTAIDGVSSTPVRVGEESSSKPSVATKESYLSLSHEAQSRTYVLGGILKHHHACQFLSFSPSFETAIEVRVDVLGAAGQSDDGSCVSTDLSFATADMEQPEQSEIATPERVDTLEKNLPSTPDTVPFESPFRPAVDIIASEEESIESFELHNPIRKFRQRRRRRRLKDIIGLFNCKNCRIGQAHDEGSQRTLWLSAEHGSTTFRGSLPERPLWETVWDFDCGESVVSETEPLLLRSASEFSWGQEMYSRRYEI